VCFLLQVCIMAPKANMKRPAAAASAPAKRSKVDPIQSKCDSVASALLEAEGLPEHVREMLAGSLSSCLHLFKADRHNFQHRVVAMVGEALSEIGTSINKSIAEAETEVASADTNRAALEAACQANTKTLEDRHASVSARKEAFEASTAARKGSAAGLKEAEKDEKAGNKELDDAAGKKEEQNHFRSVTYKELTENVATKAGTKALEKLGKNFTYDGELIKALTSAFAKAPDARGTFDKLVVTQFEEQLEKTLAGLNATLAQGEPGKQDRASKVASAKSSLEVSEVADQACSQALTDARNAESDAQKELDSTNKALAAFTPGLEKTKARCDGLKAGLAEFSENALANFKELESRCIPPPVEEQPAAEAPAAEAPAAKSPAAKSPAAKSPARAEPALAAEGVPATA